MSKRAAPADGELPAPKRARSHVQEQRAAKRAEVLAEKAFVGAGGILLDTLMLDIGGVVGRAYSFDAADERGIHAIAWDPLYRSVPDVINADALRYPVARLLAMVNKSFNAVIKAQMPDLPSLTAHSYEGSSRIWLAWYAWFAGSRTMKKSMFTRTNNARFYLGRNYLTNLSYASKTTLLGRPMKAAFHVKDTAHVVRVMLAAAIHFGHATNINLFYNEQSRNSMVVEADAMMHAYYHLAGDRDRLPHGAAYDLDVLLQVVKTARSAAQLIGLDDSDRLASYGGFFFYAACVNGRIPIMAAVYAAMPDKKRAAIDPQLAWQALFDSAEGADSVASHDWLQTRLPIGSFDEDSEMDLCPRSPTSIAWYYALTPAPERTRLVTQVNVTHPRALAEVLRQRERRGLPLTWGAIEDARPVLFWPRATLSEFTLDEIRLVLRASMSPENSRLKHRIMDWLYIGLAGVTSTEFARVVVDAMVASSKTLILLPKTLMEHGLTTFAPVFPLVFDAISDPMDKLVAFGLMTAGPAQTEEMGAVEAAKRAVLFIKAAAYVNKGFA